jgi:hypothetical protein
MERSARIELSSTLNERTHALVEYAGRPRHPPGPPRCWSRYGRTLRFIIAGWSHDVD